MNKNFTSIEDAFIYYTSCQIATLHDYLFRKAQSESSIKRQKSIAEGMINEVRNMVGYGRDDCIDRWNKTVHCENERKKIKELIHEK